MPRTRAAAQQRLAVLARQPVRRRRARHTTYPLPARKEETRQLEENHT